MLGGKDEVGEVMNHEANLAQQREAALQFRDEWQPDVQEIRFTREGVTPGLGASWRVNAVATVGEREYQVIIGPDIPPGFPTGDMPSEALRTSPSLKITFSDGTWEVVR
ncbi:hypothetical protein [Leifsonia sp. AG29]|uniref:hypothetical protein n=1 Tax=Leifsonia sp. AG29 TaxID=2598860 RepID=UPI00131BA54F|nr:hypothetical protein [Leifsonia sp. AG29]